MTITVCAVSATTPRSCVMRMTPMSKSRLTLSISSRIWAWTVTSSAVVGSSAISTAGLCTSAMAIIARWRMPPENWCGKSRARVRAFGMPTASSTSTARLKAASFETRSCALTASAIWYPTRYMGCRHANGSWKIIATSLPRTSRSSAGVAFSRSRPCSRISPLMRERFAFSSPRIARLVTLLPEPDSPTMPSVSPRSSVNERPDTALTIPSSVGNCTTRSRTSRSSSPVIRTALSGRGTRTRRRR